MKMPSASWTGYWVRGSQHLFVLLTLLFLTVALPDQAVGQFGLPGAIDPSGRSGEPPATEKNKPLRPVPPTEILPPVQSAPPEERKEKGPILRVFVKKINVVGS